MAVRRVTRNADAKTIARMPEEERGSDVGAWRCADVLPTGTSAGLSHEAEWPELSHSLAQPRLKQILVVLVDDRGTERWTFQSVAMS